MTRNPALVRRALRAYVLVGRASQIGIDTIAGVVRARVTDTATRGLAMRPGVAVVEVWGGDRAEVQERCDAATGGGLSIVLIWREATAWQRLRAASVWAWWRLTHRGEFSIWR